jgi:hypothetical protein
VSFLPGAQYTTIYAIPAGIPGTVAVSVKSLLWWDGRTWKPTKQDPCRVLKIQVPRSK